MRQFMTDQVVGAQSRSQAVCPEAGGSVLPDSTVKQESQQEAYQLDGYAWLRGAPLSW